MDLWHCGFVFFHSERSGGSRELKEVAGTQGGRGNSGKSRELLEFALRFFEGVHSVLKFELQAYFFINFLYRITLYESV